MLFNRKKPIFFQGWFWHGYEVIGLEKIPETGPALLVYYHGALPLDYYYLVAKMVLLKHRVIHSVVDNILFRIPGLTPILNTFCCTPGTKVLFIYYVSSCIPQNLTCVWFMSFGQSVE